MTSNGTPALPKELVSIKTSIDCVLAFLGEPVRIFKFIQQYP